MKTNKNKFIVKASSNRRGIKSNTSVKKEFTIKASCKKVPIKSAKDNSVSSDDVIEVGNWIISDSDINTQLIQPNLKNLKKKVNSGKYDAQLAMRVWRRVADVGTKAYDKVFGNGGTLFLNKATREAIAEYLMDNYDEEIHEDIIESATDIEETEDDYITALADDTLDLIKANSDLEDASYELSDAAITFIVNGENVYIQPIEEIEPNWTDLNSDATELSNAVIDEIFVPTESVTSATDIDEDYGYGYGLNGEPIDESAVDELYRIVNREILPETELGKTFSFCDIDEDSFDYYATGTAFGAYLKYTINIGLNSDDFSLYDYQIQGHNVMMVDILSPHHTSNALLDIAIRVNGDKITAEVTDLTLQDGNGNNISGMLYNNFFKAFDKEAICDAVIKIAEPAVREIAVQLSNI